MEEVTTAIIGGSGLYDIESLTNRSEIFIETPFGNPSEPITIGCLAGERLAFISRHGKGHTISPTSIPVQANIFALKQLGVRHVLSVSAVGSLQENIKPLDIVIPDQLIDRTYKRPSTFFEEDLVAHVSFGNPFCENLRSHLTEVIHNQKIVCHTDGTYVVIEGPQFSTQAESNLFRTCNASVVGMTALPEAKLAREAEMCYATIAMVTDYDCWKNSVENVNAEMVVQNMQHNVLQAQYILEDFVPRIRKLSQDSCSFALKNAIISKRDYISEDALTKLEPIVNKYLTV